MFFNVAVEILQVTSDGNLKNDIIHFIKFYLNKPLGFYPIPQKLMTNLFPFIPDLIPGKG